MNRYTVWVKTKQRGNLQVFGNRKEVQGKSYYTGIEPLELKDRGEKEPYLITAASHEKAERMAGLMFHNAFCVFMEMVE